ncbi:hypothetical protein C8R45DRAFT_1175593 [Mycena sanguinolenta]|nr:hypothetical protein C8R45DRAFT_1175593 [Mycena sanguinolenta]
MAGEEVGGTATKRPNCEVARWSPERHKTDQAPWALMGDCVGQHRVLIFVGGNLRTFGPSACGIRARSKSDAPRTNNNIPLRWYILTSRVRDGGYLSLRTGASLAASSCSLAMSPGLSTCAFDDAGGSQMHVKGRKIRRFLTNERLPKMENQLPKPENIVPRIASRIRRTFRGMRGVVGDARSSEVAGERESTVGRTVRLEFVGKTSGTRTRPRSERKQIELESGGPKSRGVWHCASHRMAGEDVRGSGGPPQDDATATHHLVVNTIVPAGLLCGSYEVRDLEMVRTPSPASNLPGRGRGKPRAGVAGRVAHSLVWLYYIRSPVISAITSGFPSCFHPPAASPAGSSPLRGRDPLHRHPDPAIDKFLNKRSCRPFALEGPGDIYVVTRISEQNARNFNNLDADQWMNAIDLKGGHTKQMEHRRSEYTACESGQKMIWICKYGRSSSPLQDTLAQAVHKLLFNTTNKVKPETALPLIKPELNIASS